MSDSHEWNRERAGVHRNWRRGLTVLRAGKFWYIKGEPYTAYLTLTDAKMEVQKRPVAAPFTENARV